MRGKQAPHSRRLQSMALLTTPLVLRRQLRKAWRPRMLGLQSCPSEK